MFPVSALFWVAAALAAMVAVAAIWRVGTRRASGNAILRPPTRTTRTTRSRVSLQPARSAAPVFIVSSVGSMLMIRLTDPVALLTSKCLTGGLIGFFILGLELTLEPRHLTHGIVHTTAILFRKKGFACSLVLLTITFFSTPSELRSVILLIKYLARTYKDRVMPSVTLTLRSGDIHDFTTEFCAALVATVRDTAVKVEGAVLLRFGVPTLQFAEELLHRMAHASESTTVTVTYDPVECVVMLVATSEAAPSEALLEPPLEPPLEPLMEAAPAPLSERPQDDGIIRVSFAYNPEHPNAIPTRLEAPSSLMSYTNLTVVDPKSKDLLADLYEAARSRVVPYIGCDIELCVWDPDFCIWARVEDEVLLYMSGITTQACMVFYVYLVRP